MERIVIVSNRVPVPSKGGVQPGGLAVVLKDAVTPGTLWFGWSGTTKSESSTDANVAVHDGVHYATIDLAREAFDRFYLGYANGTLWPLLHFRLGLIEFRRESFEGYQTINDDYARALLKLLRPDDLIWVHDYHLIPLAAKLRRLGVKNRIGFFLHVPFVPSSVFAALPQGDELLKAFCAYDVVGFQTCEHRRNFVDCARQLLGLTVREDGAIIAPERLTRAIVTPVGIDAAGFKRKAERSINSKTSKRLKDSLTGRALMIGVERLDYSKGLPDRFEAFNRLLSRFPEHRQKVSFLQIAAPSREEVKEYAALRPVLNRMAGDINGRHGTFDWVPLRYMSQRVARSTLAGFFRAARIGLVTPLRDGMNLVAHEYVAAQDAADPGILILSKFAGVASYFKEALIVNPYDPDEIAEAMHIALQMPLEERRRRHLALFEQLGRLTTTAYCAAFVDALTKAAASAREQPAPGIVQPHLE
jgi:trehalose 6-phosphate synthase